MTGQGRWGRRGTSSGPPSTLQPTSPGEKAALQKQSSTPGRANTTHEPLPKYPNIPIPLPKDPVGRDEVMSLEAWNKLDSLARSTPYNISENVTKTEKGQKIERWSDRYTLSNNKIHTVKLAKAIDTDPAFFPEELHSVLVSTHSTSTKEKKNVSFEEVLARKLGSLDTNNDNAKEDDEDEEEEVVYEEEEFEDDDDYTNAYFDDGDGYGDEGGGGVDDEPVY
jgi:hypothetical protein